jgi:DNA repair exonuclease SbcCD ATPase subunit
MRAVLRGFQDDVAEVMGRYAPGIERGKSRMERLTAGADYSDTVHRSVRELHRDLPAEIEAKRKVVTDLSAAEDAAKERVDEMRRRVDDLHARAALSAKEVKRLAVYEKRLTDRLEELRKAQTASEEAKAAADRLAEVARQDAHESRAQAGRVVDKARAMVSASVALADEIAAGTLSLNAAGKINAADPDAIRPGLPELRPALQAGAMAIASFEAQKADLARERREVDQERQKLAGFGLIIEQAQKSLRIVLELAPRVRSRIRDRSVPASERREAAAMRRDIIAAVPPLRKASMTSTASIMQMLREKPQPSSSSEKTVEEPDTDDGPSGP